MTLIASFSRFLPFLMVLLISLPVFAQGQADGVPEFMPSAGWTVGPSGIEAARGIKGTKLPCVMAGEFNNGFVVRFSGGNKEMLAMAVDFRQDVFRQGGRYAASLAVDGVSLADVQGSAFTASILVFNVREVGGLYAALTGGRAMELAIGTNKMRFYLDGVNDGLQKLEACFTGGPSMNAPSMMDASMPLVSEPPTSLAEIQDAAPDWEDGASGKTDALPAVSNANDGEEVYIRRDGTRETVKRPKINSVMKAGDSAAPVVDTGASAMWKADAGENIKDVLTRWSDQAGMDIKWEAGEAGQVSKDFRMQGKVNDAVSALMARNSTLKGHVQTAQGAEKLVNAPYDGVSASPRYSSAASADVGAVGGTMRQMGASGGGAYGASAGGDLKDALDRWCAQAGVRLIWNGVYHFPLRSAVSGSSFESAVQSALGQFTSENIRPVGRLNTDPTTSRKLLVIDSES